MTIQEVLKRTRDHFAKKGIDTARLDAEILLSKALKWERIDLYSKFDYPMSDEELQLCREYVGRRSKGEPVAYITGERGFFKSDFIVEPGVLIPRPETEILVEVAIEKSNPSHIIDLGTGSGCIGLSLLLEFPEARLTAVDVSPEALLIAKRNAEALGVADRTKFVEGNVTDQNLEKAELIVANPPYIAEGDERLEEKVLEFEPKTALFAEENGLAYLKSWSLWAFDHLQPNGLYLTEFGAGQRPELEKISSEIGFSNLKFYKDLAGHDRIMETTRG